MNFPSFSDFKKTITQDDFKKWAAESNRQIRDLKKDYPGAIQFGNNSGAISFTFSIGLLEKYHQWLSQQLEDQS